MAAQTVFVDRDAELAQIATMTTTWGAAQVLVVDGVGGIGKSQLLEEVYRRRQQYADVLHGRLGVTSVINADDIVLQIPMNLGRRLARELDAEAFREYLDLTDTIILMERQRLLTPDAFERRVHECDDTFLRLFNAWTQRTRALILLDTFEAIRDLPVGRFWLKFVLRLENATVVLAGRGGDATRQMLVASAQAAKVKTEIAYLHLHAFEPTTSQAYLSQTQVGAYLAAQPALRDNLMLLTDNSPLMLALSAEWLLRELPLPEMTAYSTEQLRALPLAEMESLREKFQRALVARIRNLREDIADLILDMAYFHLCFDAKLLAAVTGAPLAQAEQSIQALQDLFFVKQKPDGVLVLHDEMQRLLMEYVWHDVDPFGTRRKQLGQRVVAHYEQRLVQLDAAQQILAADIQAVEHASELARAAELRRTFLEQVRFRWILSRELLHYLLQVDVAKGSALFIQEYDAASNQYQYMERDGLVKEMELHEAKLGEPLRFQVGLRIAKYLLDEGTYAKAKDRLNDLLVAAPNSSERVDVLLQLGNVEIRLGEVDGGVQRFEAAAEICRREQLDKERVQVENGLGWGTRLMGDWKGAAEHYRAALKLALKLKMTRQQGWLLTNLAFVYAFQHRRDESLQLSDQALRLWKDEDLKRGLGAAYSARGSILYKFAEFDEALKYFADALAIFEDQDDAEWLSTVYCWRGVTFWAMKRNDEAQRDLERARSIGLKKDRAIVLNRLARVYWSQGKLGLARELLTDAYYAAREIKDRLYEVVSLNDLVHLDVDQRDFETLDAHETKLQAYLEVWKHPDGMALGRLYRHLGSLALGAGKPDLATHYYCEGLEQIARYGSTGWLSLSSEMDDMEKTLTELATPDFIRQLGATLQRHWEQRDLEADNPEALPVFARWAEWAN